jgi:adenosylhomocysteinase
MTMDEAAKVGDIFITATGMKDVLVGRHFDVLKDGAIICNTGHYDCEINIRELEARAKSKREMRPNNEEYTMADGRRIYLLGQGRLVNLSCAEGHPSEVMDMSFANQYLALCELARDGKKLEKKVYELPAALDQELAQLKLKTMGVSIDALTPEQVAYLTDYASGT